MKISLRQYIENPTGKGSSYVLARTHIKKMLNIMFSKMIQKYKNQFIVMPYIYDDGRVLYYVKVPSEDFENNKILFDVLIEFQINSLSPASTPSRLSQRDIKVFSNSPSFIFTYAYVYNKNNILVDRYKYRLPKKCLTQAPVVRNPMETMGFEKSTYLACRYLLESMCLTTQYINRYGKKIDAFTEDKIDNSIASPERLLMIYRYIQKKKVVNPKKPINKNMMAQGKQAQRELVKNQRKSIRSLTGKMFIQPRDSKILDKYDSKNHNSKLKRKSTINNGSKLRRKSNSTLKK